MPFAEVCDDRPKEVDTMETAKVDIRKLQLLNDRINQCIDALNQVRLSVHGLSAAQTGVQGGIGAGQSPGFEYGLGLAHSGFGQNPFPQTGIGQNPAGPFGTPNVFGQTPNVFGQAPIGPGYFPGVGVPGFAQPTVGAFGLGWNPLMAGLTHTSPEALEAFRRPIWADPFLTARITQTFPYAQLPVQPVVTIY
jgi:hypothetical protein